MCVKGNNPLPHRGSVCDTLRVSMFYSLLIHINPCSLCHRVCFPVLLPLIFMALTLILRGLGEGAIYLMTFFKW